MAKKGNCPGFQNGNINVHHNMEDELIKLISSLVRLYNLTTLSSVTENLVYLVMLLLGSVVPRDKYFFSRAQKVMHKICRFQVGCYNSIPI